MKHSYKGLETSPRHVLKPLRASLKRIIFISVGLGLLQMVSKPDTRWCASKDVEPRRGVDTGRCVSEDAGPQRGMDCEIPYRLERGSKYSL